MSVLIRGMEMPFECAECDFCGGLILPDGIYCCECPTEASHGKNISDAIDADTRADFCPLIEVKTPHGDLVDRDELEKQFKRAIETYLPKDPTRHMDVTNSNRCHGWTQGLMAVREAPTVIEAERSEE